MSARVWLRMLRQQRHPTAFLPSVAASRSFPETSDGRALAAEASQGSFFGCGCDVVLVLLEGFSSPAPPHKRGFFFAENISHKSSVAGSLRTHRGPATAGPWPPEANVWQRITSLGH